MFNIQNNPFLLQTIDLDWDEQPMPLGNLTVCIIAMSSAFHRLECIPLLIERMSTFHDLKRFEGFSRVDGRQIATFWTPELPKSLAFPTKPPRLRRLRWRKMCAAPRGGSSTATPARSPARWCCCLSDPRSVVPFIFSAQQDMIWECAKIGSYWILLDLIGPMVQRLWTLQSYLFLIIVLLAEAAICRRACDSSVLVCRVPKWDGRGKN